MGWKTNFLSKTDNTVFISIMENLWPMHIYGPYEKGRNVIGATLSASKKRPGSNLSGFSQFNLKNDFDVIFTYKVRSLWKYFMNRLIGPLQNTSNWFCGCVTNLMFIRLYNKQSIQCKFALADDHLNLIALISPTEYYVHVHLVIKK